MADHEQVGGVGCTHQRRYRKAFHHLDADLHPWVGKTHVVDDLVEDGADLVAGS